MIYRRREGELYRIGINWCRDEWTRIMVALVLPVWILPKDVYPLFYEDGWNYGYRLKLMRIRFRVNRMGRWFFGVRFGSVPFLSQRFYSYERCYAGR